MDLKQLEALRAIAETGSFTLAAARLRVTQPALSHQIKRLEQELGQTLLLRSRPQVSPSSAGQRVLGSLERIFTELDDLTQSFAPRQGTMPAGTLRIAATSMGIVYLYGKVFEDFIARYPLVELTLTATETPHDAVKKVIARTTDAAFALFPLDATNLDLVFLGSAEQIFIAGRKHPLARAVTVSVNELKRWPFIRYQPGTGARPKSDELFLSHGGYPPILIESNDTEFIKRIVGLGLGVAMVPAFTVLREIRAGTLRFLRLPKRRLLQDFGLVYRKGVKMKALDLFREVCVAGRQSLLQDLPRGPRKPGRGAS